MDNMLKTGKERDNKDGEMVDRKDFVNQTNICQQQITWAGQMVGE